jgi:hypothetical protein
MGYEAKKAEHAVPKKGTGIQELGGIDQLGEAHQLVPGVLATSTRMV